MRSFPVKHAYRKDTLFGSLREATNLAEQKVAEKRQKEQIEKEHIEKAAQQSQAIETERSKILRQLEEPEVIFTQHGFRLMPALDVSVAEEFKLEGASPYISIESLRRDLEDFKSQVQEEDRVLVELAESHLRLCHALELESLTVVDINTATKRLMNLFRSEFEQLKPGEHVIIPGGSRRFLIGGHAVIYKITKKDEEHFQFEIFNTGTGSLSSENTNFVRAFRVSMPKEMLQSEEFLTMLFHPILEHAGQGSYVEVMQKIRDFFKQQMIQEEIGPEAPHQKRATCTFESATAYLRSIFPEPLFEAFELFYTEKASKTFAAMLKTARQREVLLPEKEKTVQERKARFMAHVAIWEQDPALKARYQKLFDGATS